MFRHSRRCAMHGRGRALAVSGVFLALVVVPSLWAQTQQRLQDVAEPKTGMFTQIIPIEVPAYHGVEPHLALDYSSSAKDAFPGVGWSLDGIGTIRGTKNGRGVPTYTSNDVYLLGASCTAGGTHATKEESYLRVKQAGSMWSVWSKDGTRTDYAPVYGVPEGTVRWGQSAATDTHGNQASYLWACDDGDCYPSSITFGPYAVTFYREGGATSGPSPTDRARSSAARAVACAASS
jgi:hypothetical protein